MYRNYNYYHIDAPIYRYCYDVEISTPSLGQLHLIGKAMKIFSIIYFLPRLIFDTANMNTIKSFIIVILLVTKIITYKHNISIYI